MGVAVAGGGGDGGAALLGDRQEMVGLSRREHRVHRDLHVAVGPVLEADRAGEARGQLAVDLAFRGPGADRAPGHEVGDVLRRHHVQELAGRRQPQGVHVDQQPPRQAQPVVDHEAAVQARVVDQAFPADRGARLLEVDPHDHLELARVAPSLGRQPPGVIERRFGIVDGTGADDHHQPVVLALQDGVHGCAGCADRVGDYATGRSLADHLLGRTEHGEAGDAEVFGGTGHDGLRGLGGPAGMKKAARSLAAGGIWVRLSLV